MKTFFRHWLSAILYALLAGALAVSAFSFFRSDQYWEHSRNTHHQTFEIHWRASQIREKTAVLIGHLDYAVATGEVKSPFVAEVDVIAVNISALLALEHTPTLLSPQDIDLLNAMLDTIDTELRPDIEAGLYADARRSALNLRQDALTVAATVASRSQVLSEEAFLNAGIETNRYRFTLALAVVVIIIIFIHHRAQSAQRKDEHLRSFSALFGHITRSRIAPLRLVLNRLDDDSILDRELVALAQQSVQELIVINEDLMRIAYAGSGPKAETDGRLEPLSSVFAIIASAHDSFVRFKADEEALSVSVPASQFHLLIDELVVNAEKALMSRENPKITITARIARSWLLRRRLVVTVADNGKGMTREVLAKAQTVFFSTRGGSHVGLGLSSCTAILKAMGGRLQLEAWPDVGTTARIIYPLRSSRQPRRKRHGSTRQNADYRRERCRHALRSG